MPQLDRPERPPAPERGAPGDAEPIVSKPGRFQNDPADPKNPNEEIERHRRKLRPKPPEV